MTCCAASLMKHPHAWYCKASIVQEGSLAGEVPRSSSSTLQSLVLLKELKQQPGGVVLQCGFANFPEVRIL